MPATCAACMKPITARQKFVIAETEVMHKACAAAGVTTVLWVVRQQLAAQKLERLAEQRAARQELEHRSLILEAQRAELDDLRLMHEAEIRSIRAIEEDRRRSADGRVATSEHRIKALEARVQELEKMTSQSAAEPITETSQESDPMGIAARFSLLEFD